MEFQEFNDRYVIRVEKGEELIQTLTDFCKEQGITGASLMGIGATDDAELGYYDTDEEEYYFQTLKGDHEIAPVMGNVSLKDGEPFVHAHANLAGSDQRARAGHLKRAVISATCEVFLDPAGEIKRNFDEETGLDLFDL